MRRLTAQSLSKFTSSKLPVLVVFSSTQCPPCKVLADRLAKLKPRFPRMKLAKVDIDLHESVIEQHNIRSVPTMVFFVDGAEVKRSIGAPGLAELHSILSAASFSARIRRTATKAR